MDARLERTGRTASCSHGVLRLKDLVRLGWSTNEVRHRVRRGEWRRLLVGVLLVDPDLVFGWAGWAELPLMTRVSAARAYHGREAVLVGSTAARMIGLDALPADDGTVHLRLPPGRERHQQPGVRVHTWLLSRSQVTTVAGVCVTDLERTVTDLVLSLSREEAVSMLDGVLRRRLLSADAFEALRCAARGRRGVHRTSSWWRLADGRSESPLETRIRLIAVDAGLPPDELQLAVHDSHGVLLGYGDMAWQLPHGRWLVAEADGRGPHEAPAALFRDRRRANDFLATGTVDMVRFTWADAAAGGYVTSVLRRFLTPRPSSNARRS